MFRCGSEEAAAAKACEVSQFYGLSVFGGWFVGTTEQSAWRCDTTFVTGCCRPCCADAARSKLALFGEEVAHV